MTYMTDRILISSNTIIIVLHNMHSFKGRMSHTQMPNIYVFSFTHRFNNSRIHKGFSFCSTQQGLEKTTSQFKEDVNYEMEIRLKVK